MYILSLDSIRRATGQRPRPTSLPTLPNWLNLLRPKAQQFTFADDTAVLTTHEDSAIATLKLQTHLKKIQLWLKKWRMKENEAKSVQVTFTPKKNTCPPVQLNNKQLTQTEEVKYLGIHLDRKPTWRKHVSAKRKQLYLKLRKLYWIIGRNS